MEKKELVRKLLAAKEKSGKTYDQIARKLGVTNAYAAQWFQAQAQLPKALAPRLKKLVPGLTAELLKEMQKCPLRSYDPTLIQEPNVYRMTEVCLHYGQALRALLDEKFGDGIMSAIDFRLSVDKVKGDKGEDRVVITMNGKFLPHIVQTQ